MISRYRHKGLTWVDIESPTPEEVLHIMEEFSLPQLVSEELATNSLHSKVDLYEDFLLLILHFPLISHGRSVPREQEVDFVIGKDFLITVRYEMVESLYEFSKAFEVNSMLEKDKAPTHGGMVFMEMIKQLYRNSLGELDEITKTLKEIENEIFRGHETQMVRTISITSRKLLDFKQAVRFHRDVLRSYENASKQFFGEIYTYYATSITAEFNKVYSLLQSHHETILELQRTNDSLLSTKSNDIMRTFTIMTFVMMPLTLITGLFGMNAEFTFITTTRDFFFIIGAMLLTASVMYVFFKIKRWV